VEFLLLERQGEDWLALASRAKRQRPGKVFFLEGGIRGEILPRREGEIGEAGGEGNRTGLRGLRFTPPLTEDYLEKHGHIPLPPYIRRPDTDQDRERYQTVYARETGSAAAPTAGLHFTPELMDRVRERAWGVAWVTLHVGLGTFLPVRSPAVEDHRMHREVYTIRPEEAALINRARREGKKILAVGTTTLRALESACRRGEVAAGEGSTSIFIYPGYRFQMVDRLLTNFHTPESTLLMLVSALAGRRRILAAYAEAIKEGYRFFSFGDAMLIL
jgi:S-adenosylmethionine:tRNA ribosyltransferase-isomerase